MANEAVSINRNRILSCNLLESADHILFKITICRNFINIPNIHLKVNHVGVFTCCQNKAHEISSELQFAKGGRSGYFESDNLA